MKVTIVGAGRVGSTTGYCLLERNLASELVLVDVASGRAQGEALDLLHCMSSFGRKVSVSGSADYTLSAGSNIVVITAGIPRKPGDSRLDLLKKNTSIIKDISQQVKAHSPNAVVLVVSNPVDVMTYVAQKVSGFEHERVFGLGTMLDSTRFNSLLADQLNLSPKDVRALMLGEHGDSMFPAYSQSLIREHTIAESGLMSGEEFNALADKVRQSAAEVIRLKGATYFAPAVAITEVVSAIVGDKRRILPVSVYSQEHNIYVSSLAQVSAFGAKSIFMHLNAEEKKQMEASVAILKQACAETGCKSCCVRFCGRKYRGQR